VHVAIYQTAIDCLLNTANLPTF